MPSLELRPVAPEDYDFLDSVIDHDFDFHGYSEERWKLLSRYILLYYLAESPYAYTAFIDDERAGMLLFSGRSVQGADVGADLDAVIDEAMMHPDTKLFVMGFEELMRNYRELRLQCAGDECGELNLIAILGKYQGNGFGRKLLDHMYKVLRDEGLSRFTFYTDDDCNVGFYDHLGATRAGNRLVPFMGEPLMMYCYLIDI